MPNRRTVRGCPRAHFAEGAFPNGPVPSGTPTPVVWAAEIARRLESAIDALNITSVAAAAGVGRQTIYDIVRGTTWPDLVTIVQLQEHLGVSLLPTWTPVSSNVASS